MRKASQLYSIILVVLAMPCFAYSADLTTFSNTNDEQARIARYTAVLGASYGDTAGYWTNEGAVTYASQGLYDYVSYAGNGWSWWSICDGNTENNSNTYDWDQRTQNYFGATEDFFGYQFKEAASVSEIVYSHASYGDGGTFAAAPRVEVLVGGLMKGPGTWQEISVTWDTPYNTYWNGENGAPGNRTYTITPTADTGNVYGVRIIGAGRAVSEDGTITCNDATGFISCAELQVSGTSTITETIDLSTNLALNQTPLWTVATTQNGAPERLVDGDILEQETTWNASPSAEEFVGVLFDTDQSNVAAIGITHDFHGDGGALTPSTLEVEYTTDAGATWTSVTGLDLGRYTDDFDELAATPWSHASSALFTFDTIPVAIDGIRMIGETFNQPTASDSNGFISVRELEVFAAANAVPEPSTIVLFFTSLVGLFAFLRRR